MWCAPCREAGGLVSVAVRVYSTRVKLRTFLVVSLPGDASSDNGERFLWCERNVRRVLPSLEYLLLHNNQVTDAGCSTLAAALSSGAVPALKFIFGLENGNPASAPAVAAVSAALASRRG